MNIPFGIKILRVALLVCSIYSSAQSQAVKIDPPALPGKGLLQHDFLLTGEADNRHPVFTIYLVHKGKVAWSYDIPVKDSTGTSTELGYATMRPNGNVVFCRKTGATEVSPDKKVVWNYDTPKGTEIHAVEAVGEQNILVTINGVPSRTMMIDSKTGNTLWETHLPVGKPSPHLQFRRTVWTSQGTIFGGPFRFGRGS